MFRFLVVFIVLFSMSSHAQVTVHINSGDPAFPFPQFLPYANPTDTLGNLGTKNSQGVSHAEMEQIIRDAYQIQMNRASKPGGGVGGIDYIKYASSPQCSEGDGYGLLGPAAMADKETFDGMWLYIHDFTLNKVKKYSDCTDASPGYGYSQLPGWTGAGANSAADGDFDIALALLQAYKQWGEFMGIDDACGNPISYKQAAIDFLTALTDTVSYSNGNLLSGDVGLDGYFKGGDSWAEMSGWSTPANLAQIGVSRAVEQPGPTAQYFDYTAPGYFRAFADFLAKEDSARYAWNIFQFRRAEASSDWLMGELYDADPRYLPICGNVKLTGTSASFGYTGSMGEDFRLGWRTILNRMWHGNPSYSWNPTSHQVEQSTPNLYLQEMANRYATFLWDSRQPPWNNSCIASVGTDPFTHWGPQTVITDTRIDGSLPAEGFFFLNWLPAVGSPSAVVSQNFNLISELYRYIQIEWDVDTPGDGYITSVPFYFHGWYRMLGLLVLSGNYHTPSNMKPTANTKVYMSIDKSFAFEQDTVTYTIEYRNYGSLDATGTKIVDTLHRDFVFVSASGGGIYDNVAHTVTWNIGTLPGFKTATGIEPTEGKKELKVVIANASKKQYRNKAHISCTNGTGWTSNDYPNRITPVMERNHLDIARRALVCNYSASKDLAKPGETVDFEISFLNSSEAGWINGGRPGVNFSFSQGTEGEVATMNTMRARLFNDAQEAYIDFGNYRISYFLYDETNTCIASDADCDVGWAFMQTITEGIAASQVKLVHENIVPGQDEHGKWNQRLIVQFGDPEDPAYKENLTTIDRHLSGYRGISHRIHLPSGGGTVPPEPLRLVWFFNSSTWQNVNWGQAWSWDGATADQDGGNYFPVTNDWADPDKPDVPVTTWNRKACEKATKTVDNILVEEWDGYTWRRVAGNGPMPGREVKNVVIRDTLPNGLSFVEFTGENPMGVAPQIDGKVISWSIPRLQIMEGGTISFKAIVDGSCPGTPDAYLTNRAWISADKESSFADSSVLGVSCDTVIKPPPPDHIDIVLDILTVDQNDDHEFVRIELDEGTLTAIAYAVVRDRNGKFIRRVENAQWTVRDNSIATVTNGNNTWQGDIVKVSGGSTIITVTEPANPQLTPDSLAITAIETPPWPAMASAVMSDENGDITPDFLTIVLNDTFHVDQQLDSIIVDYKGTRYPFAATELSLENRVIRFPLTVSTGADPTPTGQVTMVLTVDGAKKRGTREITDGVGPALSSVSMVQDISGTLDTLRLSFTEDVMMQTLPGATLQLISAATGDTTVLTVVSFRGPEFYTETEVVVTSSTGVRPQEGDFIRLVPGTAGGTLEDRKKNLPHQLNKPVIIPARPAQFSNGWYADDNADGIVEAVYIKFQKPVRIDSMNVSLTWTGAGGPSELIDNLSGANLSFPGDDHSLVRVALPLEFTTATGIKTDGAMFTKITFSSNVSEVRIGDIADKAAPVITAAIIRLGTSYSEDIQPIDTLQVTFSESVAFDSLKNPFKLLQNGVSPYTLSLRREKSMINDVSFIITGINGVDYPATGDSIFINPESTVGDMSNPVNWQNNPLNRRVALVLQRGGLKWSVIAAPNPMNPDLPVYGTAGTEIKIVTMANASIPLTIQDATISIYDPVGNSVVQSARFEQRPAGTVFMWNGTNRKGRKVGNGTYIGVVTVNDKGAEGVKRVKVGVSRKRDSLLPIPE